jgi:two-component system cell cycle sensor histidine kinase/response regulator CckA
MAAAASIDLVAILLLSIFLQLVAAVLALGLIRKTGRKTAWLMIVAALFLMTLRRVATLLGFEYPALEQSFRGPVSEIIALMISMLMVAAVLRIREIFSDSEKSERELRLSEERFRQFFAGTNDAIFVVDGDGRYVEVNPRACEMLGYDRDELLRMSITDVVPQDFQRERLEWFEKLKKDGAAFFELRMRRKDGTTFPVEHNAADLHNGTYVSVVRDLSHRLQAEERLREEHSLLRATLESTADGILVVNLAGKIVSYNERFRQMWRIPAQILATHDDDEALSFVLNQLKEPGKFLAKVKELYARHDAESFDVLEFKDGRIFERFSRPQLLDGRPVGRVWSFRDVTERRRAEEIVRASEERWRAILNLTPNVAVEGYDVNGRVLYWNKAAEKIFGWSEQEALGKTLDRLILDKESADLFRDSLQKIDQTGAILGPSEWKCAAKDGREVTVYSTIFPVTMADGKKEFFCMDVDITDRKRAEEALQESSAKYRLIVENVEEIIYRVKIGKDTIRGVVEYVSPRVEDILGYKAEEFISDPNFWLTKIHPDDLPCLQKETEEIFAKQQNGVRLYRFKHGKTGEYRWMEDKIIPLRGENGDVTGFQGAARDITEQKQAEESLREMNLALAHAMPGISRIDRHGKYVSVNDEYARMLGFEPSELVGMNWQPTVHPEDRDKAMAAYQRLASDGKVEFEARAVRKDGSVFHKHVLMVKIVDSDGNFIGHHCFMRDITERKRTEETIRSQAEENLQYRQMITHVADGVFLRSLDRKILTWNPACERIFGYTASEAIGRDPEMLNPPDIAHSITVELENTLAQRGYWEREVPCVRKDGAQITVLGKASYVYDTEGHKAAIVSVNTDITDRKVLQAQLAQAQKMESIGMLAGGIAHDFNNLLTGVLGYTALAMSELGPNHPVAQKLQNVEKSAQRAAELTRQLLAFGRRTMFNMRPFNVNQAVDETVELLRHTLPSTIEIRIEKESELATIEADPTQIQQILLNLAVNARDAMPNGGTLTITTRNRVLDEAFCKQHYDARPGNFVAISVNDTGMGIAEENLLRIFEPFFTTKGTGKGTGLGLAMVYGLVKSHNGFINVTSAVGKGTAFTVYLPQTLRTISEEKPRGPTKIRGGNETILVVDDEENVRTLAKATLQTYGYRVLLAADGVEALEVFQKNRGVGAILLDLTMPRMNGRECFERLRKLKPDVRVILSSGFSVHGVSDLLADGACGFVQKPYRLEELARIIRETLDKA